MAPEKSDQRKQSGFSVSDRRSFTESGEPKADAPPPTDASQPAAAADAPPAAPAVAAPPPAARATSGQPDAATSGQPAGATSAHAGAREFPPVDFHTFILSLGSSALLHLGELDQPDGKDSSPDLPLAKHTIDIIGMLQDKTRGNLSPPEERLIESLLYDLRLRYVERSKPGGG